MGNACAQAGHCRSWNSMTATRAPGGGLSIEVSLKLIGVPGGADLWALAVKGIAVKSIAAKGRVAAIASARTGRRRNFAGFRRIIFCFHPIARAWVPQG